MLVNPARVHLLSDAGGADEQYFDIGGRRARELREHTAMKVTAADQQLTGDSAMLFTQLRRSCGVDVEATAAVVGDNAMDS